MCQADGEKTEREQEQIAEGKTLEFLREHLNAVEWDYLEERLRVEGIPSTTAHAAIRNLVNQGKICVGGPAGRQLLTLVQ
jgi:hypothetical protein